jgi:hypothetical protein
MDATTRRTLRNGLVGGLVGTALGFVPLVLLVSPVLGGGVAGYLEREGFRHGALAGAVAGVVMAAFSTVVTAVVLFVRFGDLPFGTGSPLTTFGVAALLSLVATIGQVFVAGVGGALGAVLASGRSADAADGGRARPWVAVVGSLLAGLLAGLAVALTVTFVLDPLIWPSALVGLPVGFVAGAGVAVLVYRYATRDPESAVDWRVVGVGVLALLVVFGLLLGGLSLLGQQRVERSVQSTYEYRVTVSADGTLENATVYVPVPEANGESELGARFVQDARYDRDVPAIEGYDPSPEPVNFTYDVVETDHGRMLAISADRIDVSRVYYREVENETVGWRERIEPEAYDPDDPTMGVRHDGHFSFGVTVVAEEPIETADPFETEPLLGPRYNRSQVECAYGRTDRHRCYTYDGRIYADYDADPDTTVYVSTELSGRNEWFSGGWTGNEYRQWAAVELQGPGTGWYRIAGELDVGSGRYRD